MTATRDRSSAKQIFTRNFRDYLEGNFNFQQWFERHKELEKRYGPQPWPGLKDFFAGG